eukprot:12420629-Alexandrium_andersonii.AAC.1
MGSTLPQLYLKVGWGCAGAPVRALASARGGPRGTVPGRPPAKLPHPCAVPRPRTAPHGRCPAQGLAQ